MHSDTRLPFLTLRLTSASACASRVVVSMIACSPPNSANFCKVRPAIRRIPQAGPRLIGLSRRHIQTFPAPPIRVLIVLQKMDLACRGDTGISGDSLCSLLGLKDSDTRKAHGRRRIYSILLICAQISSERHTNAKLLYVFASVQFQLFSNACIRFASSPRTPMLRKLNNI